MIRIDLASGFLVYLTLMLIILTVLIAFDMWRSHLHHWTISEKELAHCRKCSNTFIVERTDKVGHCPRCNSRCNIKRRG